MMDASMGVNILNREVKGVNHMEMSSHPDMRALFENILNNSEENGFHKAFDMSL